MCTRAKFREQLDLKCDALRGKGMGADVCTWLEIAKSLWKTYEEHPDMWPKVTVDKGTFFDWVQQSVKRIDDKWGVGY